MNEMNEDIARSLRVIKNILVVFLAIVILYLLKMLSDLFVPLAFALFFAILLQVYEGLVVETLVPDILAFQWLAEVIVLAVFS